GRYAGQGPAAIKLNGQMGKESREFVYETTFQPKTNDDRDFVEHIWARRKVGYLLDQIRANGEKKELMDELLALAKKYAIATPFTSHLIVPDAPMPVAGGRPGRSAGGMPGLPGMTGGTGMGPGAGFGGAGGGLGRGRPEGLAEAGNPKGAPNKVIDFAMANQSKPGDVAQNRGGYFEKRVGEEMDKAAKADGK